MSPSVEIDFCNFVCKLTIWIKVGFGVLMKKPKSSENVAMGSPKKVSVIKKEEEKD